jgi:S-adenosylmethionine hydrolase
MVSENDVHKPGAEVHPLMPSTITLITDFGLEDGHVGAMKGVIRNIAHEATIVDISHFVPPQDIGKAAYVLFTAYLYYPSDTVHVIVVDPGVGTERRAIALQTSAAYFVAPDNGVLSYVLDREVVEAVVQITNPEYWHHPVSDVFHGRDIFGSVGAHLARGVPLQSLGEPLDPASLVTFPLPRPERRADGSIIAQVMVMDSFGNLTTNLPADWLASSPTWEIEVAGQRIRGLQRTFGDVAENQLVAFIDSEGFLAIAVRNGNAACTLGTQEGDQVLLRRYCCADSY